MNLDELLRWLEEKNLIVFPHKKGWIALMAYPTDPRIDEWTPRDLSLGDNG